MLHAKHGMLQVACTPLQGQARRVCADGIMTAAATQLVLPGQPCHSPALRLSSAAMQAARTLMTMTHSPEKTPGSCSRRSEGIGRALRWGSRGLCGGVGGYGPVGAVAPGDPSGDCLGGSSSLLAQATLTQPGAGGHD